MCLGYNYRMSDIQAALGISQMKKLDKFISKRRKIAYIYEKELGPLSAQWMYEDINSSYHLYIIRTNNRDELRKYLKEEGIGTQIHYKPIYLQPYYKALGYRKGICPVAEQFSATCLSIPIYPTLKKSEVKYVIKTILKGEKKWEEEKKNQQ